MIINNGEENKDNGFIMDVGKKMSTREKVQVKVSGSTSARWIALLIVSVTMMFG